MPVSDDGACDYTLADVNEAEQRIRAECPGAHIARGDYDWALSVANPAKTMAYIVYRPCRRNDDGRVTQSMVIGNVDKIIAKLNDASATRSLAADPSPS